jgi:hypothetical protein
MSCPINVSTIESSSYIGNSLAIINSNFTNLKDSICGDGQLNDKTESISLSVQNLNTRTNSLSSSIIPAATQAWVHFSGNKDETNQISVFFTNRKIYNKNNIFSVYRLSRGQYRATFETPLPTRNYTVIGTSSLAPNTDFTPSTYGFVSVLPGTQTQEEFDIIITNNVDPDYISLAIF